MSYLVRGLIYALRYTVLLVFSYVAVDMVLDGLGVMALGGWFLMVETCEANT